MEKHSKTDDVEVEAASDSKSDEAVKTVAGAPKQKEKSDSWTP